MSMHVASERDGMVSRKTSDTLHKNQAPYELVFLKAIDPITGEAVKIAQAHCLHRRCRWHLVYLCHDLLP